MSEPGSCSGVVLVIDDEEMVRDVAVAILGSAGHETLSAPDGAAGVELFRQNADRIDVVLLDMKMPGMDGPAACAAILEIRADANVILSSGFSEADAASRFEGMSLAGFVQKPYRMADMLDAVAKAMAG